MVKLQGRGPAAFADAPQLLRRTGREVDVPDLPRFDRAGQQRLQNVRQAGFDDPVVVPHTDGHRHPPQAVGQRLHCGADGAGIQNIQPHIVALVDPRKHKIRLLGQHAGQRRLDTVGRGAGHGPGFHPGDREIRHGVQLKRAEHRDAVGHGAALLSRRHHPDPAEPGRHPRQAGKAGREDAIVVDNKNVQEEFLLPLERSKEGCIRSPGTTGAGSRRYTPDCIVSDRKMRVKAGQSVMVCPACGRMRQPARALATCSGRKLCSGTRMRGAMVSAIQRR